MNIPGTIFSGDSATWRDEPTTDNLGNPVDSTWVLTYGLRQDSVAITLTATTYATGWETTLSKTNSALLVAGPVYWQAYAEKTTSRITIGSGQFTVRKAIAGAAAGTFSNLSQVEQDLTAVQAAIRSMIAGGAVAEYTIGGRQLRKIPIEQLIAWESRLKSQLVREKKADRIANGLGNPSNLRVRF